MLHPLNPANLILGNPSLPPIIAWDQAVARKPPPPEVIIDDILHRTAKLTLASGSKSFKTWSLMHLAIAVSSGGKWWGHQCHQAPVLYVNFELQDYFCIDRFETIKNKLKIDSLPNLKIWNLRGHAADIEELEPKLDAAMAQHQIGLTIIDPVYKLYGGKDENSATDVAEILNTLERLGRDHNTAIVLAHHFRKGGPGDKAAERMSGSGVWHRDGDAIIIVEPHEDENHFVVTPDLRNFKPMEPFGVRWEFPLFHPDQEIDPTAIKGKKRTEPKVSSHQVASLIPHGKGLTKAELRDAIMASAGGSKASAYRYITAAIKDGNIGYSPTGDLLLRK